MKREVNRNKIQSIVTEVLTDQDEFVENHNLKQRTSLTKLKQDLKEKLAEISENFKKTIKKKECLQHIVNAKHIIKVDEQLGIFTVKKILVKLKCLPT